MRGKKLDENMKIGSRKCNKSTFAVCDDIENTGLILNSSKHRSRGSAHSALWD